MSPSEHAFVRRLVTRARSPSCQRARASFVHDAGRASSHDTVTRTRFCSFVRTSPSVHPPIGHVVVIGAGGVKGALAHDVRRSRKTAHLMLSTDSWFAPRISMT